MKKKLLSVVVSGAILAGLSPAAKAQEVSKFQKFKNSVVNVVKNHKKIIIGGAATLTIVGGAVYYYRSHRDKKSEDESQGLVPCRELPRANPILHEKYYQKNLIEFLNGFATSRSLKYTVSQAKKLHEDLFKAYEDPKTRNMFKGTLKISDEIKGIQNLPDDAQGTLVLTKCMISDEYIWVKFEFERDKNDFDKEREACLIKLKALQKELNDSNESFRKALKESILLHMSDESEEKKKEPINLVELGKFKKTRIILKCLKQGNINSEKGSEYYNEKISPRMGEIKDYIEKLVISISTALKNRREGKECPENQIVSEMDDQIKKSTIFDISDEDHRINLYTIFSTKYIENKFLEIMNQ